VYNFENRIKNFLISFYYFVIEVLLRATAENPVSNGGVFAFSPHVTPHP
jgi:hypothetical protein